MPRAYISYRRADSAAYAGRLYDRLAGEFGSQSVFLDVSGIAPGEAFGSVIDDAIRTADIVIVIIGPRWLGAADASAARRLDHPDDFVRREVATALASGTYVIPVLVDGAVMPSGAELPSELAPLALRNALDLTGDWNRGTEHLPSCVASTRSRRRGRRRLRRR